MLSPWYCLKFFWLPSFQQIQDDSQLVIGWGTSVKIALIKSNQSSSTNKTYKHKQMSSMNQVDIVASFQNSCYISGIAPFGDNLVVLAYIPEKDGEKEITSSISSHQVFLSSFSYYKLLPDSTVFFCILKFSDFL